MQGGDRSLLTYTEFRQLQAQRGTFALLMASGGALQRTQARVAGRGPRPRGEVSSLLTDVRRVMQQAEPKMVVAEAGPLSAALDQRVVQDRLLAQRRATP
jgi:hypothetical protein